MKAIDDANDSRSVFVFPAQGKFKITINGKLGKINLQVLSDQGWDWDALDTSNKFPSNLLELFRAKAVRENYPMCSKASCYPVIQLLMQTPT